MLFSSWGASTHLLATLTTFISLGQTFVCAQNFSYDVGDMIGPVLVQNMLIPEEDSSIPKYFLPSYFDSFFLIFVLTFFFVSTYVYYYFCVRDLRWIVYDLILLDDDEIGVRRLDKFLLEFIRDRELHRQRYLEAENNARADFDELVAQSLISESIKEYDPYIELIFNVYVFYKNCGIEQRTVTCSSILYASTCFIKAYYSFSELYDYIDIIIGSVDKETLEAQSGLHSARKFVDSWKDLSSSELNHKLSKVVKGLLSCGMAKHFDLPFTPDSYKSFLASQPTELKLSSMNGLMQSIADFVVSFAEVGYECFVDKSLAPVLIKDRATRNWIHEYQAMVTRLDELPVTISYDPNEILASMDALIGRGNALMNFSPRHIGILWKNLMDRRSRFMKTVNVASNRRCPFSVLIHGPPGIGKSTVTQLIATIYHRTVTSENIYPTLEWDPRKNLYTYNSEDQYWSSFQGATHWAILMDDLAREHPRQISSGKTTSISDVITIVNSVGIATTQAAIEDKGCIPLIPKLVLATTNTKDLNAGYAVAEKSAVLRRFPYVIKPVLKPEYLDPVTGIMKKMSMVVHDAWEYEIETVTLQADTSGKITVVYKPHRPELDSERRCTSSELCQFLKERIIAHERSSAVMEHSLTVSPDIHMCPHGILSYFHCNDCTPPPPYVPPHDDEVVHFDASVQPALEAQAWWWPGRSKPKAETLRNKIYKRALKTVIRYTPGPVYDRLIDYFVDIDVHTQVCLNVLDENIPTRIRLVRECFLAAAAGIGAYYLITRVASMFLGQSDTPASPQKKEEEETEVPDYFEAQTNIWAPINGTNDSFLPPITLKRNNLAELQKSLDKSSFALHIEDDSGHKQSVFCFSLRDGWYVTVQHAFSRKCSSWKCVAAYEWEQFPIKPHSPFILEEFNLKRLPNDLVMFHSANILPRKELYNFLPQTIDRAGRNIHVYDPMAKTLGHGTTTSYKETVYQSQDDPVRGYFMDGTRSDRTPKRGDCGSIIISESMGGYFISGIHCAGSPHISNPRLIVSQISKEMFETSPPILAMSGYGDVSKCFEGSSKSGALRTPHLSKGVHHWAHDSCGLVMGSYPGRVTSTSRTRRSKICSEMEHVFSFENPFTAPLMTAELVNGEWINPFTIAAEQQGKISPHFKDSEALKVANSYIYDMTRDSSWLKDKVGLSSLREAVNGVHGDSYINILPMGTSGGFFFPGNKRQYFELLTDDEGVEYYHPNQDVLDMVTRIEENYALGIRSHVLFNGTLKDEPVKLSKRISGKTRVFTACDVAMSIVMRKQYLRVIRQFMKHNFITECAVSMNCYSLDWDRLYQYLTAFGEDRIIAGDYSAFDKAMPPVIIRTAFYVLDRLRAYSDFSTRDVMISRGIATDISFPVTNMNGDLIQFFGGNSSGHPLTVIINSIANSLYVRLAYYRMEFPLEKFRENVRLMTLGDDNIMGSNHDGFNHTSIASTLAKMGIPYTMADKDSVSVPFINIKESDFLKRSFVLDGNRCVAPLALNSVFKSLCMYVEKGNISHEEQLAQSYLAARREWSLHGREVFNDYTSKMSGIFERYPDITRFFIRQHSYTFTETLNWVLNEERPEEQLSEGVRRIRFE
jgi:hypothetical protein